MCTPHYREIPGGLCIRSSETERDVLAQMEDGFGEALLNRFRRNKRNLNVPFNGHRQAVTGPPVIAEGYRNSVPDEVFAVRQE